MILRLWLLVVLTLAGAFAPSRASARTAENRTWDFFPATANARPESAPQVADSHLGNLVHGYELAPGYSQAAESAGARAGTTRLGVVRNNPTDWRATRDLWDSGGYGEILSPANRAAIAKGRTPVVDQAWVRQFPEDAGLLGERIPMHHIQGTPITTPLPATRHLDAHMPGGFRYNPGGPGGQVPIYAEPPH